jgi:translation initiation factor IF-3
MRCWRPKKPASISSKFPRTRRRRWCKILDLGKLKYANQKKAAEARKHQKVIEIKEIKMRPNIDDHDYDVKMRAVRRFFEEGDKVKLTLRFRGREMAHMELGMKLLNKVKRRRRREPSPRSRPSRSSKAGR